MAPPVCALCSQVVEVEVDYYRQLDCSRDCADNFFHEPCIEKYLRKMGRGPGQKTGFNCPGVLPNGKPCLGTVKKTHIRLPSNTKKKEQNKQAAIAVNVMVNTARPAGTADPSVLKQPISKAKVVKVAASQRPAIVIHNRSTAVTAIANSRQGSEGLPEDDFSNFRQIGKRTSIRDGDKDGMDDEGEISNFRKRQSEKPFETHDPFSRPSKATSRATAKTTATAWAVSKNSSMAPEPVVRQQPATIPGWTEPSKVRASVSNLAEQRALVAALRAQQGNAASANRAVAAGAGGSTTKAVTGTGCMDKTGVQEGEPTGAAAAGRNRGALAVAPIAAPTSAETAAATQPMTPPPSSAQQQQHIALYRSSSGSGDAASLPTSVTASPNTPDPSSPASVEDQDSGDGYDHDIVEYDPEKFEYIQLFSAEDGSVVVQDLQTGVFVRMEDVYGTDPKVLGFQDESGGPPTYYVVIRKPTAAPQLEEQQQLLQAGLGLGIESSSSGFVGSTGTFAVEGGDLAVYGGVTPVEHSLVATHGAEGGAEKLAAVGGGAMWGVNGSDAAAVAEQGAGEGAGEGDEDDIDELLALCLG